MAETKADVLLNLKSELARGFIEKTFDVMGKKWTFVTLNDAEEGWVDTKISMGSGVAMFKSRMRPAVAAALRKIDGVAVADLFKSEKPSADNELVKSLLEMGGGDFTVAEEVFKFLGQQPRGLVAALYDKFKTLEDERDKVVQYLKN